MLYILLFSILAFSLSEPYNGVAKDRECFKAQSSLERGGTNQGTLSEYLCSTVAVMTGALSHSGLHRTVGRFYFRAEVGLHVIGLTLPPKNVI